MRTYPFPAMTVPPPSQGGTGWVSLSAMPEPPPIEGRTGGVSILHALLLIGSALTLIA